MKKLFIFFMLSILACSSDNTEQLNDNVELTQIEQPLMASRMGNLQFGFRPSSEIACVWGTSNQSCIVPKAKELRFYITGGNSSQRQAVRTQVNSWYTSMVAEGLSQESDGWLFGEASSTNDQNLTLLIDVDTGVGFCSGTGTDTQDYSCYTGSTSNLNEVPGIFGSYMRWVAVPVLHIDYDEMNAISGLNATQKSNVFRQSVWSGLDRYVGIGLVTIGDNRCNKATIVTNAACFVTSAQACAANSFGDAGNQTNWLFGGPDCGQ